MAITVDWDNDEQRILRYTFTGTWTWEEFFTHLTTGRAMMRRVNHDVHIVCDLTESGFVPKNSVKPFKNIVDSRPANTGVVFIITNAYLLNAIYLALKRVYPQICEQYRLIPDELPIPQYIQEWETRRVTAAS